MAYTKIIPIRTRLDKAVNYALNKEKTGLDNALDYISDSSKNTNNEIAYETAINCTLDNPYKDMINTKKAHDQTDGVLGYHIIQSFMPNEVTAASAHSIGVEFTAKCFGNKYEAVVSTHLDRHHYHNHIIMNSVSFMDGTKFENSFTDYFRDIRQISDSVCKEYSVSIISPNKDNESLTYNEWLGLKKGKTTWQTLIRSDIDHAISTSYSFGEFLMDMEHMGYEIKHGKYLAFRPYGKERYSRCYKLGEGYSEDEIRARISREKSVYVPPIKMAEYRKKVYTKALFMPNFIREYWRTLYSLNLVKKHKAPPKVSNYSKEDVQRIEKYKEQFRFLKAHNLGTESEFFGYVKLLDKKISSLHSQLRSFDNKHKSKKKLFNALADIRKYKKPYELYMQGYTMMKKEYAAYLKAQNILRKNDYTTPASIETLKKEKVDLYEHRDEIKKDTRLHRNEKRICNNILKSMDYIEERNRLIEQQHTVSKDKTKHKEREQKNDTHKRT